MDSNLKLSHKTILLTTYRNNNIIHSLIQEIKAQTGNNNNGEKNRNQKTLFLSMCSNVVGMVTSIKTHSITGVKYPVSLGHLPSGISPSFRGSIPQLEMGDTLPSLAFFRLGFSPSPPDWVLVQVTPEEFCFKSRGKCSPQSFTPNTHCPRHMDILKHPAVRHQSHSQSNNYPSSGCPRLTPSLGSKPFYTPQITSLL